MNEEVDHSCPAVKQESRAVAKKPRDIHYKFKSNHASKARLQSSKHTGAKQFNAKWPFKVTCFGVSGKAIRY